MHPLVLAALITSGFTFLGLLVQRGSNRHSSEHGKTRDHILEMKHTLLDVKEIAVETRLDLKEHVGNHDKNR